MPDSWDAFAAREPYFAVLTQARFLRENFDYDAQQEFFESGEHHVGHLFGFIANKVAPRFTPLTVLEYGCGVGRLLMPFARRAERVTGVDISPAMLETAGRHLALEGIGNVTLLTAAEFAGDESTFDLVNCHLVLQRMRPREGLALLRRLVTRVREGGVGVFQMPYRSDTAPLVRVARTARLRVPGINAIVNAARGKPLATPLIATSTYDVNAVLAILQENGYEEPNLLFARHGDLDTVTIHARRPHQPVAARPPLEPTSPEPERTGQVIDVRKLIAGRGIDQLNATAERYFASLDDWEHHLAKPFARFEDTPQLLISFGALLQGMSLAPGMTVLEFGAGTGWLSRFLTQLGCRMILLDVSPTALRIARELYSRQPVIGDRPEPSFLVFDGVRIDLPNASVDRILCFDAFHHAPNPESVLREFGRVLKARGIAAFAEPGPNHSLAPQSQFEMRTYGVVENDIDIHAIADAATRLGFTDLKLAAFNVPPYHVTLAEYDDLLDGGETYGKWAEHTRGFLRNVRLFFLTKAGAEEVDNRKPEGFRSTIAATISATRADQPIVAHVTVRNSGRAKWLPSDGTAGAVSLGFRLYDEEGVLLDPEWSRHPLPRPLDRGEQAELEVVLPALAAGRYLIEIDCVAEHVAWFGQLGSPVARIRVSIE